MRSLTLAAAIAVVVTASAIGIAQSRRLDDNALRNSWRSGEWVANGNNPGEWRYSPLDQINASNVSRLGLAWTAVAGDGGGNQEATPLVWDGVLYSITNWSIVFAVDARSGKELWRYDPAAS